jgi:hypothetical protein
MLPPVIPCCWCSLSDDADAGAVGFRANLVGPGQTPDLGLGSAGGGHGESDPLSVILVRPYGILGDAIGTAIPLTCSMIFSCPIISAACWNQTQDVSVSRIYIAYRAMRPPGCRPSVNAALVRPASIEPASDTTGDSGLGIRHGLGLGVLDPSRLGCWTAGRKSGR